MNQVHQPGMKPMLGFSVDSSFDSNGHIFEAKWQGFRCIASITSHRVRLYNRRLQEVAFRYPELSDAYSLLEVSDAIVDGELIALGEGKPDYGRLTYRESLVDRDEISVAVASSPVLYVVFDILSAGGRAITDRPQMERKEILKSSLHAGKYLVIGTYVADQGKEFYDQMIRAGFEGMVAKAKDSLYFPGERNEGWLKVRQFKTQDCLICGYTMGMGRRAEIMGALVLGVYEKGRLMHVGQVGSGFTEESLKSLRDALDPLKTSDPPFLSLPVIGRPVTWVVPELICRVEFSEWTSERKLRQPRIVDLRSDKPKTECTVEDLAEYKRLRGD